MERPAIIGFAHELAQACKSGEHSVEELLDVLRWRACLRYGFPVRNPQPRGKATLWTIDGVYFGATPTSVVDAVLRAELRFERAFGEVPRDAVAHLSLSADSKPGARSARAFGACLSRLFASLRSPKKEAV